MRAFYAEGQIQTDEGETLTLVCDFYTIDIAESITGQDWDDILPQLTAPSRSLAVKVLYALLRKKHPNVTLDEAAGVSYDKNQVLVWTIMGDVIRRACNFDDEEAKGKNPPKRRGRSKSSEKSG